MATTHKERLNQLITALGLSKNKFAKALGTSSAVISNVTTSDVNYGIELAEKILSTFPIISPAWLLTGNGEMMVAEPDNKPDTNRTTAHEKRPQVFISHSQREELAEKEPQEHTERTVEEVRLKTLYDYQNKLNHQLRREDGELFQFKDNLEYLGWVWEDARRTMEELEVRYSATFFDTKRKMSYELFKELAVRELRRRLKYSEIIKEFSEALNLFTSEITLDKLWDDYSQEVGELDGALAVAEEDAINAETRHPGLEG